MIDKESENENEQECTDKNASDVQPAMVQDTLGFQLEILKSEINIIQGIIGRMDDTSHKTRSWAVLTWAGSIGLALNSDSKDLRDLVILTAILPIIFWYIDARWRYLQRRSIYRVERISEFLNGADLRSSIEAKEMQNFIVYDPVGRQYEKEGKSDFKNFVSMKNVINYPEIKVLYLSMFTISLFLGFGFLLV